MVLKKLYQKKTPGHDNLNPEFWKVCANSTKIVQWIAALCNRVLFQKDIPAEWHIAKVACLYKKGDPAMPENYRPISLLPIGYKIFASILLARLKSGGAEARIMETQYGFKSGAGTRDAIFIVRRLLDQCALGQDHSLIFLALDWAKAFDSVAPECLSKPLLRFGIPGSIAEGIHAIYSDRSLYVADNI